MGLKQCSRPVRITVIVLENVVFCGKGAKVPFLHLSSLFCFYLSLLLLFPVHCGGLKRTSASPELELQVAVGCVDAGETLVLWNGSQLLTFEPPLQPLFLNLNR